MKIRKYEINIENRRYLKSDGRPYVFSSTNVTNVIFGLVRALKNRISMQISAGNMIKFQSRFFLRLYSVFHLPSLKILRIHLPLPPPQNDILIREKCNENITISSPSANTNIRRIQLPPSTK